MIAISHYLSLSQPVKSIRCDWPNRVVSIKYPRSPFTTVPISVKCIFFAKNSSNPLELFVLVVRLLFDPFRITIQCQINVPVRLKTVGTLTFQIEDTSRKNSTQLKKGITVWARATAVRSKHRGNRYLTFCNEKT